MAGFWVYCVQKNIDRSGGAGLPGAMGESMHLSKQIESMYDDAARIRQDLHRIPEIGFQLRDTQAYVLRELKQCGPDRIETPAVCGVKAVFFAKDAETTIAFRADMDGIHNDEANDVPYCSQRPGNMHGCGHDGHMTILLLLARWIAKNRAHIHCNIVLLFQPGEEGWAGARRMIDDGALENPKVDRIYGLHLWPTVPKGKIGVRWDYLMAQTSDFEITVHGKSAHASTPQMGIDAIVVAAELITMVQTVITRDVDPHQDALLTLGKIQGGTSHNVIAEEVTISGTLRVFSNDLSATRSPRSCRGSRRPPARRSTWTARSVTPACATRASWWSSFTPCSTPWTTRSWSSPSWRRRISPNISRRSRACFSSSACRRRPVPPRCTAVISISTSAFC